MPVRPRLSQLDLWTRHQRYALEVFREALHALCADPPEDTGEDALNRALYFCILEVTKRRISDGTGSAVAGVPFFDGKNRPNPLTAGSGAEFKRPDFSWAYQDANAPTADRSIRDFVVECKRLGERSSASWDFNRNYVEHGIFRFTDLGYSYGKDARSGAMVGYVQSLSITRIRDEVDSANVEAGFPRLTPGIETQWGHFEHEQNLDRDIEPNNFALHHVWGDMRTEYAGSD